MSRSVLFVIWSLGISYGMVRVYDYQTTPGRGAENLARRSWPASASTPSSLPRLMLFGHPRCPCTVTSLKRLHELSACRPGQSSMEIIFVRPREDDPDWTTSASVQLAEAIPDAKIFWDRDAQLSAAYGIRTSGHVLAFDADGALKFSGGMTPSRGHDGESSGAKRVRELIERQTVGPPLQTPVFGCPLFGGEFRRESGAGHDE